MFSKPGRAKNRTNPSKIEKRAKILHRLVMLSALQLLFTEVEVNSDGHLPRRFTAW